MKMNKRKIAVRDYLSVAQPRRKINKRRALIIAVAVLLAVAAVLLWMMPPSAHQVPQALENSLSGDGRFEFSCMLETGGEAREYFWLVGESSGERRHISGRVLGSPLEMYYIEGQIYRYDQLAGEWHHYPAAELAAATELYAELDPASAFDYDSLIEIEYLGSGSSEGRRCYNFSVIPAAAGWVAEFFTDIRYIVSLSRGGELVAAELLATLQEDPQTMMRAFVLWQEDDGISIELPSGD